MAREISGVAGFAASLHRGKPHVPAAHTHAATQRDSLNVRTIRTHITETNHK